MARHLLGIQELNKKELYEFIANSQSFVEIGTRALKKVPALRGKTVINLFLEPSTRTRTSFEIAAKRLSADAINISPTTSSLSKGESLLDMARTLESMHPDVLVIRHNEGGAPHFLARHLSTTCVVNAGDGMHEHPSQALLDLLTLSRHFASRCDGVEKLTVAIVGDIRHSRVARSWIWAHKLLGNDIRLVGPPTLVPAEFIDQNCFGAATKIRIFHRLSEGLEGADVVLGLRVQLERQNHNFIPSLEEYSREFGISEQMLSRYAPNSVVLHPGPFNRGIEVASEVLDGNRSLVRQQVENGVAVRMAVLFTLVAGGGVETPREEMIEQE